MSIINRNQYDCPNCSNQLTITVYDSINVDENPELKDAVLSGTINSTVCGECGKTIVINQSFMYHDMKKQFIINYVTEHADLEEVQESSRLFSHLGEYTLRYTNRLPDLVEKIKLFDSGLNDIAVQLLKMNLGQNESLNRSSSIQDIVFLLFEEDTIVFQGKYLDGTSEIISIGYAAYLQVYQGLQELDLLGRDKRQCIYVNDEYIMELLKDYL